MKTVTKTFMISNKLGLHARAAAQLVKMVNHFNSEVTISNKRQSVNAKSIMGVLMLAASKGTNIVVQIEGNDASEAMQAIEELISNKFGED